MNTSKFIVAVLCAFLTRSAFSQSVVLDDDRRSVDMVVEAWTQFMDNLFDADYYGEFADPYQSFSGNQMISIADSMASVSHSSSVTATRMMGEATVMAQTDANPGVFEALTAVSNSNYTVNFTVTETISVSLVGELYSSGDTRANMSLFEVGVGNVFAYEADVGAYLVDEFFELDPGSYRFRVEAGAVRETNGSQAQFGEARYSFDMNVIPAPSGLFMLMGGGLIAARRRRY
jgi:hypothetical protein